MYSTEAALKYFLTQALASVLLLFAIVLSSHFNLILHFLFINLSTTKLLFSAALLLKAGAAPFHFWFPGVIRGLSWINCALLSTLQKFGPIVLISYVFYSCWFSYVIIFLSAVFGGLGGLNQTSLRKIIAYSSINHLRWMLASALLRDLLWLSYFFFYSFLSISVILNFAILKIHHFNQIIIISNNIFIKLFIFCNFLSLGGLPPFLGFLPKWSVIQALTASNITTLIFSIVMLTLTVLFFYLRLFYISAILFYPSFKWAQPMGPPLSSLVVTIGCFSLLGLTLTPAFNIFL